MSIYERDWYREAWSEKENKNKVKGNAQKQKKEKKVNVSNTSTDSNINTSTKTNINTGAYRENNMHKAFLGKVIETTHENKMFYSRISCGNCNYINTMRFSKRPNGTYWFYCKNCNKKVIAIIVSHSVVTWTLIFLFLILVLISKIWW